MNKQLWVVVNWCDSTEGNPGCFGCYFLSYNDAWDFANKDAAKFKEENQIEEELVIDEDTGRIDLSWYDVDHHWEVQPIGLEN